MKKKLLSILLCLMLVFAVGCSNDSGQKTITDREGNEVKVPNKIEKIISTAPSNTEILAGLGLADKIIAADTYSEGIEGLSKDTELMDFQTPDAEKIIELNPDIIIASGYNQVGSSEDPYKSVSDAGIPVVYIPSSNSIDGIYKDIAFIKENGSLDETNCTERNTNSFLKLAPDFKIKQYQQVVNNMLFISYMDYSKYVTHYCDGSWRKKLTLEEQEGMELICKRNKKKWLLKLKDRVRSPQIYQFLENNNYKSILKIYLFFLARVEVLDYCQILFEQFP